VNTLRLLGRWMRRVTIPNQSSVAKAYDEFEDGRMKPSAYYDRIVDVMEELVRFTVTTRPHVAQLTNRYSERKEDAAMLGQRSAPFRPDPATVSQNVSFSDRPRA
jgi:arsenical resistance protein ArsH